MKIKEDGIAPNAGRLLWAGFMAILAAGVGFGIRGGILANWADPSLATGQSEMESPLGPTVSAIVGQEPETIGYAGALVPASRRLIRPGTRSHHELRKG